MRSSIAGVAMVLALMTTSAFAQKVNWNDYIERGPTKYTDAAKNANTKPQKAEPAKPEKAVRGGQPARAVAKAPPKAAPKPKTAPVRKKK